MTFSDLKNIFKNPLDFSISDCMTAEELALSAIEILDKIDTHIVDDKLPDKELIEEIMDMLTDYHKELGD